MYEFCSAALPWVLFGVMLAALLANSKRISSDRKTRSGMVSGMCLGAALGMVLAQVFGFSAGSTVPAGIMVGLTAGTLIKGRNTCEE